MFEMRIDIDKSQKFPKLQELTTYDDEYDDITSLNIDICYYFDELKAVAFTVTGFKGLKWPVDVKTDLSSIIYQISLEISKLKQAKEGRIKFYEQGLERELLIKCGDDLATIECFDLFGESVTTERETLSINELIEMLEKLVKDFILIAKELCPIITSHKFFTDWESDFLMQ